MKIRAIKFCGLLFAIVLLVGSLPARGEVVIAVPQVKLPQDELPHDVPVEWWYYSGHFADAQGRRYGVMASFFTAKFGNFPRQHFMIYQLVDKDAKKFYSGNYSNDNSISIVTILPHDLARKKYGYTFWMDIVGR